VAGAILNSGGDSVRLLRKIGNQPRARHGRTDAAGPRQRPVSSAKDLLFPSLGRSSTGGFSPREEPRGSSLGTPSPRSDLTATESPGQACPVLELYKTNGKPADRLPPHPPLSPIGGEDKGEGRKGCRYSITYAKLNTLHLVAHKACPGWSANSTPSRLRRSPPAYFMSMPPLSMRPLVTASFSSSHFTYSAPERKAGLRA
jgi:hypothetical protein